MHGVGGGGKGRLLLAGDVEDGACGREKGRLLLAGDVEDGAWGRGKEEGQIVACW